MIEKILEIIDGISFCFLFVMLSAINDKNDLKLVIGIMIIPLIWIIVRLATGGFDNYEE